MAKAKGSPKTGGRKAGTPNVATRSVKEAIAEAFEHRGGVASLVAWAEENQTEFYKLWGRLIPTDVKVSGEINIASVVKEARERAAKRD